MVTEFVAIAPQFCHTYTPYYTDTACIVNERGIFIEFEMTLKVHALYKENNLSSPFLIFLSWKKVQRLHVPGTEGDANRKP